LEEVTEVLCKCSRMVLTRDRHRHLQIGRMLDINLISEPPTPPPPICMYPKCGNLCGQRGRKRFIACWGLRMSHICPCTPCPSPQGYRSKVESRHFAHHWFEQGIKKPQVTKSGPDLSRKLLYLYMLLLKSVNIVLVSHRITGTERKIMPGSRVPYDARVKVLTIQHNHWGRFFFSIQECIFGVGRIQGKMRSTVWTVWEGVGPLKLRVFWAQ
jgi:hypothetical protein